MTLLHDDDVFSSREWWLKNRHSLIFQTPEQLEKYQHFRVRHLLASHNLSQLGVPISEMPPIAKKGIQLTTSGTTSATQRHYHYPESHYFLIEDHHIWRIEREYGLEEPGVVIDFFYNPTFVITDSGLYQSDPWTRSVQYDKPLVVNGVENTLYGPRVSPPVGSHNLLYELSYHRYTTRETWRSSLESARKLRPKFVIMAPSQVQTVWAKTEGSVTFDCPLITTRETLTPFVRGLACRMFPRVIDKMRCWDGGMSFYECRSGRLHVYDELSLVEVIDGRLVSTDFFNYCHPFVRYMNYDFGELDCGTCDCGVYGRFFRSFAGRVHEAIQLGEHVVPGSLFQQEIGKFLTWGNFMSGSFESQFYTKHQRNAFNGVEVCWSLRQNIDGNLRFSYASVPELSLEQRETLEAGIRFIVLRDPGDFTLGQYDAPHGTVPYQLSFVVDPTLFKGVGRRSKHLFVQSDLLRENADVAVSIAERSV